MAWRWGRIVVGVAGGIGATVVAAVVVAQTPPAQPPRPGLLLVQPAQGEPRQVRPVLVTEDGDVVLSDGAAGKAAAQKAAAEAAAQKVKAAAERVKVQVKAEMDRAGQKFHVAVFAPDDEVVALKALFEAEEKATLELAQRYHAARDTREKDRLRDMLRKAVAQTFDARQQWRKAEVAELAERLKKAQELLEVRQGRREDIVSQRVNELVQDERTAWNPPGPGGADAATKEHAIKMYPLAVPAEGQRSVTVTVPSRAGGIFVPAQGHPKPPVAVPVQVSPAPPAAPSIPAAPAAPRPPAATPAAPAGLPTARPAASGTSAGSQAPWPNDPASAPFLLERVEEIITRLRQAKSDQDRALLRELFAARVRAVERQASEADLFLQRMDRLKDSGTIPLEQYRAAKLQADQWRDVLEVFRKVAKVLEQPVPAENKAENKSPSPQSK